ncbi:MAG: hypothetical protein IJ829_07870 [Kiritimatiellae bacterium]|nr:hypothetical protein [Kiritimatiellia bacterium]
MKRTAVAICLFAALCASGAAKWKNLDDKSHIAGEKLTASDLVGRAVLIYYWDVSNEKSVQLLGDVEKVWSSFKTKKFRVVGNYVGVRNEASAAKIKEALAKYKVTFPVYHHFTLDPDPKPGFGGAPYISVVNHRGVGVYNNADPKAAIEAAVDAMSAIGMPVNLCADVTFKKFKALEKQIVLGKNMSALVKKLEKAKKGKDTEMAAEAGMIVSAIESAREEVKEDIATYREADPAEAARLIQLFLKTWPKDDAAADYKAAVPELKKAAAERAKEEKARAKEKAK